MFNSTFQWRKPYQHEKRFFTTNTLTLKGREPAIAGLARGKYSTLCRRPYLPSIKSVCDFRHHFCKLDEISNRLVAILADLEHYSGFYGHLKCLNLVLIFLEKR